MMPAESPDLDRRSFVASLAVGAASVTGCLEASGDSTPSTTATPTPLSGRISVAGSSTVYPLTLRISEQFAREYPNVSVSVASTGTGGGFENFFCDGESDINDASRAIAANERTTCRDNGVEYVRFQVATDALTVIVNNDADWVDCLTPAELATIWRADGATTWAAVRAEWPDRPFELYGPSSDSGTFDYFAAEIIGTVDDHRNDYEGTEQDSTIVEHVRQSRDAIGYLGFAYYAQNSGTVDALALETDRGCVEPSLSTAETGAYAPLSRPLYIYVAEDALERPSVRRFVEYYLDRVDSDLVSDVGYVPLDPQTAAYNREKLADYLDEK